MKKFLLALYKNFKAFLGGHGLARFYPIRVLNDSLLKHLKSNCVIVRGHKMFLDRNDSLNLSINGVYEEYATKIMEREVKSGDVVLDIGANIGYFTLIFAKL